MSEELRFSEGQRLEVARMLTDESSKYRRAKDELDRAAIDQGLTPRNKRERKATLRERITAESRDELSRILSPNQLLRRDILRRLASSVAHAGTCGP